MNDERDGWCGWRVQGMGASQFRGKRLSVLTGNDIKEGTPSYVCKSRRLGEVHCCAILEVVIEHGRRVSIFRPLGDNRLL